MRPLVSSWSELAPDREALDGDPWYRFCEVLALALFGIFTLHAVGPRQLTVDLTFAQPPAAGMILEATATPLSARTVDSRPSSRQRSAECVVTAGSCRLTFDWRARGRPYLWEKHTIRITLGGGGDAVPVGELQLNAPWWGDVAVVCGGPAGCRAA